MIREPMTREDGVAWAKCYEDYVYDEKGPAARLLLTLIQSEAEACAQARQAHDARQAAETKLAEAEEQHWRENAEVSAICMEWGTMVGALEAKLAEAERERDMAREYEARAVGRNAPLHAEMARQWERAEAAETRLAEVEARAEAAESEHEAVEEAERAARARWAAAETREKALRERADKLASEWEALAGVREGMFQLVEPPARVAYRDCAEHLRAALAAGKETT